MLVKLEDTPGQYIFEVHVGGDNTPMALLEVNYWGCNAAIRSAGVTEDDWGQQAEQKDLIQRVAAAVRPCMRPKAIVEQMTDAEVFAKVNQAGELNRQAEERLGEVRGPSPTSRRPTASPSTLQALVPMS